VSRFPSGGEAAQSFSRATFFGLLLEFCVVSRDRMEVCEYFEFNVVLSLLCRFVNLNETKD